MERLSRLLFLCLATLASAATQGFAAEQGRGQVVIGNGAGSSSVTPVNPIYNYSVSQTIYLQSEINQMGEINTLAIRLLGGDSKSVRTMKVYLGHTERGVFKNNYHDWETEGAQLVYNGTVSYPATMSGWVELALQQPFFYNNHDNLVVTVIDSDPAAGGNLLWYTTNGLDHYRTLSAYSSTVSYSIENLQETMATDPRYVMPDLRLDIAEANYDIDAAVVGVSPASGTGVGIYDIAATIKNNGSQPLTAATLRWSLDGVEQEPVSWAGELGQWQTQEVVLGSGHDFNAARDYAISATVETPGDQRAANDTRTRLVTILGTTTLPILESFEAGFTYDDYASQSPIENAFYTLEEVMGYNTYAWNLRNSVNYYFGGPRTGSQCMQLQWYSRSWLFFPVNFPTPGLYNISLWAQYQDSMSFTPSSAKVKIACGPAGSSAAMATTIAGPTTIPLNAGYVEVGDDFEIAEAGIRYIGIYGEVSDNYLMVDDIRIALVGNFIVQFGVTHESDPVPGAAIDIAGQRVWTDSTGRALAMLAPAQHDFAVTKEGYLDHAGALSWQASDTVVSVALELAPAEPLPVDLTRLEAVRQAGGGVEVRWATASESGNDRFVVERSSDALRFDSVAVAYTKAPGGHSATPTSYAAADPSAPPGSAYYRLRQVDRDGQAKHTHMVAAPPAPARAGLRAAPNPARGQVTFALDGDRCPAGGTAFVELYDATGVPAGRFPLSGSRAYADIGGLPPGLYLYRAGEHSGTLVIK